ncbi:MAG TPA: hypothetical protein VN380_21300 [Thermoanaerobaculia bacterium]|jgi:hypothetical protein|nr:hypothetical protein [Thermoanaerobaculia bacterium]
MSKLADDRPNDQISVKKFRVSLGREISPQERQLLLAHYNAPQRTITTRSLAAAGGYSIRGINAVYGRLAKKIANRSEFYERWPGYTWTSFLARCIDKQQGQGYVWRMHPALAEAMQALGWVAQ